MESIGVSWNRKTRIFFINPRKTKVDQNCYIDLVKTSLLPECRRHYLGNDFEFQQDSVPSHRAKVTQQFLWQNTLDFIAADEWASYSPDLNPIDYCIFDILQWFGVRRPTTSVCKSTGRERGNQKQMEGGHHWDSSKIYCTMEKWLSVVRKQNGGTIHLLITVTGYRYHAVRCVEIIGYFVLFRHLILLCISLSKQKGHIKSSFLILFSSDCSLKMLFPFVWILLLSSTSSLHWVGDIVLWATQYIYFKFWSSGMKSTLKAL